MPSIYHQLRYHTNELRDICMRIVEDRFEDVPNWVYDLHALLEGVEPDIVETIGD